MASGSTRAAPVWLTRGAESLRAGRLAEAEAILREGLVSDPLYADGLHMLGVIAYQRKQYEAAIDLIGRAIKADRNAPGYHNNFGLALQACGRLEDAVAAYRRALRLRSDHSGALNNLGTALRALGCHDEAKTALRRALALAPDFAEAHNNLANVLADRDCFDEAVASFRRALEIRPDYIDARCNLGELLTTLGRLREACGVYDDALAFQPEDASLHRDRAFVMFLEGAFERAWLEHEWRFGPGTGTAPRNFPQPRWDGQGLRGARLLVWMEQGIGDELLFAGLLPELIERAAACVVECAPKLVPLFTRSFPGALVVARADPPDPATLSDIDYQVAAGSVGRWLRPTLESFPGRRDYLVPDARRVEYWRGRLADLGPGLKVGFSWRSRNVAGKRALSATRIEQWGAIFRVAGAHFVSLQYDECAQELALARAQFGVALHVFPEVDLFDDLDEAAALTKAMDLVISTPTAVSLLSGALGVETWQLSYGPDWRTFGSGRDPWLPSITRVERKPGQTWGEAIERVASRLGEVRRSGLGE